jgi:hypothetical protein
VMATIFCDYSLLTTLSINDVEVVFREKIRKPANLMLKPARLRWEFISPRDAPGPFSFLGPATDLSFALGAQFSSARKPSQGILRETLRASVGGMILLGIRDQGADRLVRIGHLDSTGARSCVRNFTNGLTAADRGIHVTEGKRQLPD